MKALVAIALITLSVSAPVALSEPVAPDSNDWRVVEGARRNFAWSQSVILVTVINSTYPREDGEAAYSAHATAQVIKSWKGPFSIGTTIHLIAPTGVCESSSLGDCTAYLVHAGEQLLIFDGNKDPVVATKHATSRAADSKATMLILDQLVTQQRQLVTQQRELRNSE